MGDRRPELISGARSGAEAVKVELTTLINPLARSWAAHSGRDAADDDEGSLTCAEVASEASSEAGGGLQRRHRRRRSALSRLECMQHRLRSLLTFWSLSALVAAFFLLSTNLGTWSSPGDADGGCGHRGAVLRLWWNAPPAQSLLMLATLVSMAALTVRFTSRAARWPGAVLVLAFAATVVVFVAAPEFAFERAASATRRPYDHGNCTDMSAPENSVWLSQACPRFASADGTWEQAAFVAAVGMNVTADNTMRLPGIAELAKFLSRLREGAELIGAASYNTKLDPTMLDPECFGNLMDAICAAVFLRCEYATCKKSISGQQCSVQVHLDNWSKCSKDHGGKGVVGETLGLINKEIKQYLSLLLSEAETGYTNWALDHLRNNNLNRIPVGTSNNCSTHWITDGIPTSSPDSPSALVGCDPRHRTYSVSCSGARFDSGHVMTFYFVALTLFVLVIPASQRRELIFTNTRDRNARLVSALLGWVASFFIYLAGQSYENAAIALPPEASTSDKVNFYVWAIIHFIVCWMCIRHSICIAGGATKPRPSSSRTKRDRDAMTTCKETSRQRASSSALQKAKAVSKAGCALWKDCISSRGRFNDLFRLGQEIFECFVQLIGIQSTANSSDIDAVYLRTMLLSLNLVALPLVALTAYRGWGRVVAKSALILVESLFDKAFIMAGVLLQLNYSEIDLSQQTVLDQIASNLPSLFPAVLFCIYPRTAIMSLAALRDDMDRAAREREAREREEAAREIQALWRRRKHANRPDRRFGSLGDVVSLLYTSKGSDQHHQKRSTLHTSRANDLCQQRMFVFCVVISFLLGVSLWTFVAVGIRNQEAACVARIGGIAKCMRPRMYFSANGIFGATGCSFEHVTAANCSGSGELLGAGLPEARAEYSSMARLTHIDVSDASELGGAPHSWSLIPSLQSLDASGCRDFAVLPFDLCAKKSLTQMYLDGTIAQRALNWSGQLAHMMGSTPYPTLSQACEAALRDTLQSIDLSANNISLGTRGLEDKNCTDLLGDTDGSTFQADHMLREDISEIRFLEPLQKLSRLGLAHNNITFLSRVFFALVKFVNTSRMDFRGNPIQAVVLAGVTEPGRVSSTLLTLRRNPQAHLLRCLRIISSLDGALGSAYFQGLGGLTRLELAANRLTTISPRAFEGLGSLVHLNLHSNMIRSITHESFAGGLSNLQFLGLHLNRLHSIEAHTFSELPSLNVLHLRMNPDLTFLAPQAFWGLRRLKDLFILACNLTSVDNQTFAGGLSTSLASLALQDNEHMSISSRAFAELDRLERLYLPGRYADAGDISASWGLNDSVELKYCRSGGSSGDRWCRLQ